MAVIDDVKNALGVTGSYQDATLQSYINEVTAFLVLIEDRNRKDPGVFLDVEVDLSRYAGLNLKFVNGKDEN